MLMESGVHPSRAESTLTSETNGHLATDSSVFKPQMCGYGGSHEDGEWGVQKREQWHERMKDAYQPFPTQRMEEILEVKRKKEWEKEISGQRVRVKDFSAGSHQHRFGYSSTWATVEVICLNHRWASEEYQRPPGKAPWPLLCWPSPAKSPAQTPYCVDPC